MVAGIQCFGAQSESCLCRCITRNNTFFQLSSILFSSYPAEWGCIKTSFYRNGEWAKTWIMLSFICRARFARPKTVCFRFGQANPALQLTMDRSLVSTYPHGGESLYSVAALCFSGMPGFVRRCLPLFCR